MSISNLFSQSLGSGTLQPITINEWNSIAGFAGGSVSSVSNTDGNLSIPDTTGAVSVNLANDISVLSLNIKDQYTLPLNAGTAGYILSSAGVGNTAEWIAPGGGSGGVSSVSNTDNNLVIDPSSGEVVVNLANSLSVQNEIIPNVSSASSVINVGSNNLTLAKSTTGTNDRFVVIGNNSGNGLTASGSSLVVIAGSDSCGADSNFESGVVVGCGSGYNMTGVDNVVVGNGSLSNANNISCAYNTVVGHASGLGISNGHENVLIGSNCGSGIIATSNLVVGNVVVGANSASSLSTDSANNVLLGNGVDLINSIYSSSFIVGSNTGNFPTNQSNISTMQIGNIMNGSINNVSTAGGLTCCANQQNGTFNFNNDGNIILPLNSNGSASTYIQAGTSDTTNNSIDMFVNWNESTGVYGGEVYLANDQSYIGLNSATSYVSLDNTTTPDDCTFNVTVQKPTTTTKSNIIMNTNSVELTVPGSQIIIDNVTNANQGSIIFNCINSNNSSTATMSFTNNTSSGGLLTVDDITSHNFNINGEWNLPQTAASSFGQVLAYTSAGVSSWVPIASVSNTGVLLSTTPFEYNTGAYPIGTPFELLPAVSGKTYIITDIRIKLAGEFEFTDTSSVINISAFDGTTYTPYFSFTGANFNSVFHPSGWLLNYQATSSVLLATGAFIETITISPGSNQSVVINQTVASDTTADFIISLTYYLM